MASVFLAEDERLGRKVAVKRLHAESAEEMARRFDREAKVGASLNHPNIVSVYDTVSDDEGVLLVMEYVEGETLRDAIARGPVPPEQALRLMRGVASALDHAHEHGVVHRDVKPANILIGRDGRAKLADLGIASATDRTRLTQSGTVLGTAPYLAPERLEGGAGGPASDVYALAAVAHEALSGRKAVTGSTPMEIAHRVVNGPPADLAEDWPGAPAGAADVLKRGMARDPAVRQGSAGELVRELDRELEPVLGEGTRPTRPLEERVERRAAPAAAAAAAAAPAAAAAKPPPSRTARPVGASDGRPRWLLPVLGLAALAVLLVVLLSSGGGGSDKPASHRQSASAPKKKSSTHRSSPAPATSTTGSAASAGDPAQVVKDFYTSTIGGNVDHAWSISTDNLHNQVGGKASFQSGESTVKSFDFSQLNTTSKTATAATVAFADTAVHDTYTDNCTGTANLVPGGPSGWLVDHISVNCNKAGASSAPVPPAKPGKGPKKDKAPKPKGGGKGGD